jgi:hypothetical protein
MFLDLCECFVPAKNEPREGTKTQTDLRPADPSYLPNNCPIRILGKEC